MPISQGDWVSAAPVPSSDRGLEKVVGPCIIESNDNDGFNIYHVSVLDRKGVAIPIEVQEETLQPADGEQRTVVK